jgi:hypothetical protein
MEHYSADESINVGTGEDIAIADFARLVANIVGYQGELTFNTLRPDGPPQKLSRRLKARRAGLAVPGLKHQSHRVTQPGEKALPSTDSILRAVSASELARRQDDFSIRVERIRSAHLDFAPDGDLTCQRRSDKSR